MEAKQAGMIGLKRGIDILEIVAAAQSDLSFGELQKRCDDLPAPTLSRLLKALTEQGVIEKVADQGPYRIGVRFVNIAKTLTGGLTKEERIQRVLVKLSKETGESSAYFELDDLSIKLIAKHEMPEGMHILEVGQRNRRILRNGFGQVCVAFQDEETISRILKDCFEPPLFGECEYRERLKRIREDGYFVERHEALENRMRIAAPVFLGKKAFIGSIGTVSFVTGQEVDQKCLDAVVEAGKLLGDQLGALAVE